MDYLEKLKEIKLKFDKIEEQLADPAMASDQNKLIELSKKRSELSDIVLAYKEYDKLLNNIQGNKDISENDKPDDSQAK